ncbi:hypothetical protein [Nostoc sp. UHCC 0251]|uniref:hypothetical protein n=1 Tax=Nostoc sp. UHCC 0251 TaxID=3110240 RepID=UPI002B1F0755|nr:hypothetical protein [Nostoc sp. UHCC 0251]MEA5622930.1 hypothetical protein [Nostoc sp. UHCC 0251]
MNDDLRFAKAIAAKLHVWGEKKLVIIVGQDGSVSSSASSGESSSRFSKLLTPMIIGIKPSSLIQSCGMISLYFHALALGIGQ